MNFIIEAVKMWMNKVKAGSCFMYIQIKCCCFYIASLLLDCVPLKTFVNLTYVCVFQ